jgi:hypothetical protein
MNHPERLEMLSFNGNFNQRAANVKIQQFHGEQTEIGASIYVCSDRFRVFGVYFAHAVSF